MSALVPTVRQGHAPIALAFWLASGAFALAIDDPRLRYPQYLVALAIMGAAWLWTVRTARALSPRFVAIALAAALALRIAALLEPPAFSEDVFRYVYEGRVVWSLGPGFPFAHPPSEAPLLGVEEHLLDDAWLRINHPHITTIYPPLAQSVFALAGALGTDAGSTLLWLKGLLLLAELGILAIWIALLRRDERPIGFALAWALCPLPIFEIAREGHADSTSALGLALGIYAFTADRPRLGWTGFALAALAKLNGVVAMAAALRSERRGAILGFALISLLALPFLFAGAQAGFGLTQYATRWRAGDGLFSLVLLLAEMIVAGDWRHAGDFVVTKHGIARAITAIIGLAVAFVVLKNPAPMRAIPARAGLLLLVLLLIGPTLHPWYVLWVLPFVVLEEFAAKRAILALAFLAPLLHHPGWIELERGTWTDLAWIRALVHIPVWTLLLYAASPWRSKKGS